MGTSNTKGSLLRMQLATSLPLAGLLVKLRGGWDFRQAPARRKDAGERSWRLVLESPACILGQLGRIMLPAGSWRWGVHVHLRSRGALLGLVWSALHARVHTHTHTHTPYSVSFSVLWISNCTHQTQRRHVASIPVLQEYQTPKPSDSALLPP